jgi:regulator of sigma E protease
MFGGLLLGGDHVYDDTSMRVNVAPDGPAAAAGIKAGDKVVSVNGEAIVDWDQLKRVIGAHPGEKIDIEIDRNGEKLHVSPLPHPEGHEYKGKIMIGPHMYVQKVTVGQAALLSLKKPPEVVYGLVKGLARMISGKEKPELSGPVGIVKETANAARNGIASYLMLLGALSAYLGGFNLLPVPALDGGRLLFLGFEAASRRRADAKVEAKVHAIGLLMFLALIAVVTYTEVIPKRSAETPATSAPATSGK